MQGAAGAAGEAGPVEEDAGAVDDPCVAVRRRRRRCRPSAAACVVLEPLGASVAARAAISGPRPRRRARPRPSSSPGRGARRGSSRMPRQPRPQMQVQLDGRNAGVEAPASWRRRRSPRRRRRARPPRPQGYGRRRKVRRRGTTSIVLGLVARVGGADRRRPPAPRRIPVQALRHVDHGRGPCRTWPTPCCGRRGAVVPDALAESAPPRCGSGRSTRTAPT